MKILFITNHKYLPEIYGGMELNTDLICKELINLKQKVAVACSLNGGVSRLGISAKIQRFFSHSPVSRDHMNGYTAYRAFELYKNVDRVISDFLPDAIILQGGHKYFEILKALSKYSIPVISYLHTPDELNCENSLFDTMNITYIANSEFTKKAHLSKNVSLVLPPVVFPESYKVNSSNNYISFVNPSPHKGLKIAIELAKINSDLKFLFVLAKKNGREILTKFMENEKLPENITIVGPFQDMKEVYKQTKLILMPSRWQETWGRIATEAHCSGIPVLASDTGGLPESVGSGGINLPVDSSLDDWQKSFKHMLEQKNYEFFSKNALIYSKRECIDPEVICRKLLEHIEKQIVEE
ncbi:glycosyltransferase [Vibrio ziniensis]|uniref:Glycosyltransferase family 4 protein n=1 Tax=Vibrio ziniensis TaxID=2711221 RepID=A0A6G7CME0_9VIBR|nr:glycosyltransferase [Vibrio ziniensis]QIH43297.1 glycosyltransferase family 4 protein [Vibrio ziniensis]